MVLNHYIKLFRWLKLLFLLLILNVVFDELKSKSKLREGLNFDIVLEAQEIYDRLSKFNPVQLEKYC